MSGLHAVPQAFASGSAPKWFIFDASAFDKSRVRQAEEKKIIITSVQPDEADEMADEVADIIVQRFLDVRQPIASLFKLQVRQTRCQSMSSAAQKQGYSRILRLKSRVSVTSTFDGLPL